MRIRQAEKTDLPRIEAIFEDARRFMRESGNPGQWGSAHPNTDLIQQDIDSSVLYICEDKEGEPLAVFALIGGEDSTYASIEGQWLNDEPYHTIHRLASTRKLRGTASYCLNWAKEQHANLRIDTHEANLPMKSLIEKSGFVYCGIIRAYDGTPRRAYQYALKENPA